MKKLLTNKIAENFLIGIILLFNAHNWVFRFVPSNIHYKSGSIRNVKRYGIRYQLDLSDYQEWLVYFYCKSDSSDHLLNYLKQSKTIFDIGANIGQTALNMFKTQQSKRLNPTIYAFEPYPKTFHKLKTNIDLNKNNHIRAFNIGLSNEKGILHMTQHSPSNSGGFRMTQESTNTISVPVISLDEFVYENHINHIDFIKIDVEGFEIQVIEGARKILETFKPILIFEYSLENIKAQNGDIQKLLNQLLAMNYKIQTKEGVTNLDAILELDYQTDIICFPN
nr:FkbM family methyltransferase [uncultured Fluviicola sp.]